MSPNRLPMSCGVCRLTGMVKCLGKMGKGLMSHVYSPSGSPCCTSGRFSTQRKHLRSFNDFVSTLAADETMRAGLNCTLTVQPPSGISLTRTDSSAW